MATLNEVIARVDDVKPNTYDDNTKAKWLCDLDGKISLIIMHTEPPKQYVFPEDADRELLVGFPHDRVYDEYLKAMIDYNNREYNSYNNSVVLYNNAFDDYAKWYIRNNMPPQSGSFRNMF